MAHRSTERTSGKLLLVVLSYVSVVLVLRPVRYIILGVDGLFADAQEVIEAHLKVLVKAVHLDREDWFGRVNDNFPPMRSDTGANASGRWARR